MDPVTDPRLPLPLASIDLAALSPVPHPDTCCGHGHQDNQHPLDHHEAPAAVPRHG